jgi:hypothetical protein
MLTSKLCRNHASKCIQTAETLQPIGSVHTQPNAATYRMTPGWREHASSVRQQANTQRGSAHFDSTGLRFLRLGQD